ncbi:MAG: SLBB domain-containing protein, partial [Candidatus Cloacimonadota bacterium]|nr:SLBB domain-containing protein [Candidatus Cloacimonadota bacterium]
MKKYNLIAIILICTFLLNAGSVFALDENISQRLFYNVSVVGQVKNPGTYKFPPTSRISDAIKYANIPLDT